MPSNTPDKKFLYNVSVDDGKYTFRLDDTGHLDVLRYGETWWTPTAGSKAIISLVDGEEKRQNALRRTEDYIRALRENGGHVTKTEDMLHALLEIRGELTDDAE